MTEGDFVMTRFIGNIRSAAPGRYYLEDPKTGEYLNEIADAFQDGIIQAKGPVEIIILAREVVG